MLSLTADFLRNSYFIFLHRVLPVLHICITETSGSVDELTFYARGLDQSRRTRSSPLDVHHAADQGLKLLAVHFTANQLFGLLSAYPPLTLTNLATFRQKDYVRVQLRDAYNLQHHEDDKQASKTDQR